MKYCSNCGNQNEDENKWCISCGSKLDEQPRQQTPPIQPESQQVMYEQVKAEETDAEAEIELEEYEQPVSEAVEEVYLEEIRPEDPVQSAYEAPQYEQETQHAEQKPEEAYYGGPQQTDYYRNPVVDLIKYAGSSKLFIAAVILFTVSVGVGIVSALTGTGALDMGTYVQYYQYLNIDTNLLLEIISRMNTIYRLFSLIGQIPSILIAVGLWMFFIACRDKETNFVAVGGLNMIKVVNIVMFILACIGMAVAIIALIFAGTAVGAAADYLGAETAVVSFLVAFVIVILIIAVVLIVFYYLKLFKTINTVKYSATTGQASDKISIFLIVMNFINALGMVSMLAYNVANFLIGGASIAFLIIINIMLIKYRSEMKQIMYQNQQ